MAGYLITDRHKVTSVPALDVKDPDLAQQLVDMPLTKVDSSVERYTPDPETKDTVYDMRKLRLHFGEFLKHHSIAKDSTGWTDQFKKLAPGVVGDASLLVLNDAPVATFRRDGRLSLSRLGKEQPQIIAKYTKMKWVEVFDEDAFKAEMPDVHAAYRGRSFRLKTAGAGAGLVLPI